MKDKKYQIIYSYLASIVLWIGVYFSYAVIIGLILSKILKRTLVLDYIFSFTALVEIVLFGIIFGFFYRTISLITRKRLKKGIPIYRVIVRSSILYLLSIATAFAFIYFFFNITGLMREEYELVLKNFISARFTLSIIIYFSIFIIIFNFAEQLVLKIGINNVIPLLTGKYQSPQEKTLLFLFLDLSSSTTIAEKLGHKEYSSFIRSCFSNLTESILKYSANVYQYVGDEIVLFWDEAEADLENSLRLYFEYSKILKSKKEYFLERFGFEPKFTAGLDYGTVIAVEIGNIKREIAYHGDVLNTASRIEQECRELGEDILISENVYEKFRNSIEHSFNLLGKVNLRGKEKPIAIYNVLPKY